MWIMDPNGIAMVRLQGQMIRGLRSERVYKRSSRYGYQRHAKGAPRKYVSVSYCD